MTTRIPPGMTEWPEIDRDACVENVRAWLSEKYQSDEDSGGKVHHLRKQIVANLLRLFGKDRVTDLSDKQIVPFMSALGLDAPGKPKPMPGLGTPYTPGPRQAMPEPPAAITNPIERLRQANRIKAEAKALDEDLADERGELWTIVAAYHDDRTFLMVFQGRMSDDWYDAFTSQHTEAAAHLEPYHIIGKISGVRSQAVQMAHGVSTKDITVRTVLKKENRK